MLAMGIGFALPFESYGNFAVERGLPGGPQAMALGGPMWVPFIGISGYLLLLFPDGHLPSPRWRWFSWTCGIGLVLLSLLIGAEPRPVRRKQRPHRRHEPVRSRGPGVPGGGIFAFVVFAPILVFGGAVAVIRRLRRATDPVERQQLRWLAWAAGWIASLYVLAFIPQLVSSSASGAETWANVLGSVAAISFMLIPITDRHRDPQVPALRDRRGDPTDGRRRGARGVLRRARTPRAVAADRRPRGRPPRRRRVAVDRVRRSPPPSSRWRSRSGRSCGTRAGWPTGSSTGSGRTRTRCSRPSVASSPAPTPPTTSLIRMAPGARARASAPSERGCGCWSVTSLRPVAIVAGRCRRRSPTTWTVDVRHQDETLGALSVRMPPDEPLDPDEGASSSTTSPRRPGLVLRNVRLTEQLRARLTDLQAAQKRLVTAQDEERRKLERNIHDGAQQQLVALQVRQRLAEQLVDRDPDKAKDDARATPGRHGDRPRRPP